MSSSPMLVAYPHTAVQLDGDMIGDYKSENMNQYRRDLALLQNICQSMSSNSKFPSTESSYILI
jgi:hypothetical protein